MIAIRYRNLKAVNKNSSVVIRLWRYVQSDVRSPHSTVMQLEEQRTGAGNFSSSLLSSFHSRFRAGIPCTVQKLHNSEIKFKVKCTTT